MKIRNLFVGDLSLGSGGEKFKIDWLSTFKSYFNPWLYKAEHEIRDLKRENSALMESEKVVVIQPTIHVDNIQDLKAPIYLRGDNLQLNDNRFEVSVPNEESPAIGIFGGKQLLVMNNYIHMEPREEINKKQ